MWSMWWQQAITTIITINRKWENTSLDKVLISLVLHELDKNLAGEILKEAVRVLKDDGKIIVTEWEPSPVLWRKILFFSVHILEPKSYHRFIRKDLHRYFQGFGLEIAEEIHCDYSEVLKLKRKNR